MSGLTWPTVLGLVIFATIFTIGFTDEYSGSSSGAASNSWG